MDNVFDFVKNTQHINSSKRPSLEETLAQASGVYDKMASNVTVSKEKYLEDIVKMHGELSMLTDEQYQCRIEDIKRRSNSLLKSLDTFVTKELQKREAIRIAKQQRSLGFKIRMLLKKMFRMRG